MHFYSKVQSFEQARKYTVCSKWLPFTRPHALLHWWCAGLDYTRIDSATVSVHQHCGSLVNTFMHGRPYSSSQLGFDAAVRQFHERDVQVQVLLYFNKSVLKCHEIMSSCKKWRVR